MSEIFKQVQNVLEKAQRDQVSKKVEEHKLRQIGEDKENIRIMNKVKKIHSCALEEAEKGKMFFEFYKLDRGDCAYEYWGTLGHKKIDPSELSGEGKKISEILKDEGFEILIGFHSGPGGAPQDWAYNYLAIGWDNKKQS